MRVGDIVIHKNYPKKMRIRSISENKVAVLDKIEEGKIWYGGRQVMDYPRAICAIENLTEVDKTNQTSLFA